MCVHSGHIVGVGQLLCRIAPGLQPAPLGKLPRLRVSVQHTQARQVSIGERRQPDPRGRAGYLRVDTVHQGQHDGKPGVYHINAVDTVTQWQVVGCTETISERHLIPVLEAMLHQFALRILGFHCDNGSEFLNHTVVKLLNKLLVEEFTKSRAYRTTGHALVEGEKGAVVRKQIGYGPIASEQWAFLGHSLGIPWALTLAWDLDIFREHWVTS